MNLNKMYRLNKYIYNFGIINTMKWQFYKKNNPSKYRKLIYEFLKEKFSECILLDNKKEKTVENKYIWFFWAQGENELPPIVKASYESILRYKGDYDVQFIDMNNYEQYVDINNEIKNKFKNKEISITQFSDVLRFNLLSQYGGLWMDATMFITGPITSLCNKKFFSPVSIGQDCYISEGKWSVFCLGTCDVNYLLFENMVVLFNEYWKRYNVGIDYYFVDYFIKIIVDMNKDLESDIKKNGSMDLYWLQLHLNEKFNQDDWNKKKKKDFIYKLSYKEKYAQNESTYYGKLIANKLI